MKIEFEVFSYVPQFNLSYFIFSAGCYTSHISVLTEIQKKFKGQKNYQVLVLEDNLEVTSGMSDNTIAAVQQVVECFLSCQLT